MNYLNPIGSVFNRFTGGGRKTRLPPLADPVPTPEDISEQAVAAGGATRRRQQRRKGRKSTILTEGVDLRPAQRTSVLATELGDVGAV